MRALVRWFQKIAPRWVFLSVYGVFASVKNAYNLLIRYGLLRSCFAGVAVDASGSAIPWFSHPSIEYLEGLDLSALSVLEFGAGSSTLYWSRRAKSVLAIEHNPEWADRITPRLGTKMLWGCLAGVFGLGIVALPECIYKLIRMVI